MKIVLKQIDGLAMAGKAEESPWVPMDAPESAGGHMGGARPMQVMLIGMAGCAAMDVVSILKKRRADIRGYEMTVDAILAEEHPKVFTRIAILHKITGVDIKVEDVEMAIQLTDEKYCGALTMAKKDCRGHPRISSSAGLPLGLPTPNGDVDK